VAGGDAAALLVLSEPLDGVSEHWVAVPDAHVLVAENGHVAVTPFTPFRSPLPSLMNDSPLRVHAL